MNKIHRPPSPEAQAMLDSLQSAVRQCLERKYRLGQYAVVWHDGQVRQVNPAPSELDGLLSERSFLLRQLEDIPSAARLTRMSDEARLGEIEYRIRQLGGH